MVLVPILWAKRVWTLPCLTAFAPSKRYAAQRGQWRQGTHRSGPGRAA